MPESPIAAYLNKPLDVEVDLSAKLAFDAILAIDYLSEPAYFVLGQVLHAGIRADSRPRKYVSTKRRTYSVDVSQGNLDSLIPRNIYASNSSQSLPPATFAKRRKHPKELVLTFHSASSLSLFLFVLGVFADYHDDPIPAHNFALLATLLH